MKLKDMMNLKNIKNFIEGNMNYLKQNTSFAKLDTHIQEQAIMRAAQCMDCLEATKCKGCGCQTPHMFYAPSKEDHFDKWGIMMDKGEWQEFKKRHSLKIPKIDLAAMEVRGDYLTGTLDMMMPWEIRTMMQDLLDRVDEIKKSDKQTENETEG